MKPASKTKPMFALNRTRSLIPAAAAFALALSWSSVYSHADDLTQTLQTFATQEGKPAATVAKVTTLTATADDLARAVYQLVVDGANPGDTANAALTVLGGKVRADFNTIAPRILNAAILGVNQRGTEIDGATLTAVLNKVLTVNSTGTAKVKLNAAAVAAVTGQALADAPDAATGRAIATTALAVAFPVAPTSATPIQTFVVNTLKKIGSGTGSVPDFVSQVIASEGVLSSAAAAQTFAANLAAAEASNPAAAGAVAAGFAVGQSDATIETYLKGLVVNTKLAKNLSSIVGQVASNFQTETEVTLINALKASSATAFTKNEGAIVSGALQAAHSTELTTDILGAANITGGISTDSVLAGQLAVGNGTTDGTGNSRAAEVLQFFLSKNSVAATQTKIGEAVLKSIATVSPDAAVLIGKEIATAEGATGATAGVLAGTLAKSTTVTSAAGSVVAGVVKSASSLANESATPTITAAAIKADSKATLNIVQAVTSLDGTGFNTGNLGNVKNLATALVGGSAPANQIAVASSIAAGAAVTLGYVTDSNGNYAAQVVQAMLNANPLKLTAKATTIAAAVATAADYQETSAVATTVASFLATPGSTAAATTKNLNSTVALATSLAKIIQAKPNVSFDDRKLELGELAASIVGEVFAKSAPNANESKLIASIGTAVIKALSAKLYPNVSGVAKIPADISDAIGFVAGSVLQAIAYQAGQNSSNGALQTEAASLLGTDGASTSALLASLLKTAGKNAIYQSQITSAFNSVNQAFYHSSSKIVPGSVVVGTNGAVVDLSQPGTPTTGAYSIGSVVVLPESPVVSI